MSNLPTEQVNAILSEQVNPFHQKRYLGGFSVEPDISFNVPITAIVPLLALEPNEIPFQMEIDFDEEKYWISTTNLTHLPDQGVAEIEIPHFSDLIVGAIDGIDRKKLDDLCTDPRFNPNLAVCEDFDELQPAYCLLKPEERPPDAFCCKEQSFDVVAQAADFSVNRASGECDIVLDNVQVTFHECTLPNGSSAPPQGHAMVEVSAHCPQDTIFEIDVQPSTLNLFACDEDSLTATITATAPDGTVLFDDVEFPPQWEALTPDIVTISIDGTVEGDAVGATRVLAKASANSAIPPGEALVSVRSNIRSFSLSPPGLTMEIEEERLLEATPVDADGNLLDASDVIWSSGNPSVAALLGDDGPLTSVEGVGPGTTEVEATFEYECETVKSTAGITVGCSPVSFAVVPSQLTMQAGVKSERLDAVGQDKDGNPLDLSGVQWSSSMPDVALLDVITTGPITYVWGLSEGGPAIVKATYDDNGCKTEATAEVTVTPPPLITVEIAVPDRDCLAVGETIRLQAAVKDAQGNYWPRQSPILWRSRDEDVATVDSDGLVTGLAEGPVRVEASFEEDGKVYWGSAWLYFFDLNGIWDFTEVADETACGSGTNTYTETVSAWLVGNNITFLWPDGLAYGIKTGCTIGGYGVDDGTGYSTYEGSLTIRTTPANVATTISGTVLWEYTSPFRSCSGSSDLSFTRPTD